MSGYVAWIKVSGCWRAVAEGGTLAECDGRLLTVIRAMPRVPVASAVLPAGVHPGDRTARNEDDAMPRTSGPPAEGHGGEGEGDGHGNAWVGP